MDSDYQGKDDEHLAVTYCDRIPNKDPNIHFAAGVWEWPWKEDTINGNSRRPEHFTIAFVSRLTGWTEPQAIELASQIHHAKRRILSSNSGSQDSVNQLVTQSLAAPYLAPIVRAWRYAFSVPNAPGEDKLADLMYGMLSSPNLFDIDIATSTPRPMPPSHVTDMQQLRDARPPSLEPSRQATDPRRRRDQPRVPRPTRPATIQRLHNEDCVSTVPGRLNYPASEIYFQFKHTSRERTYALEDLQLGNTTPNFRALDIGLLYQRLRVDLDFNESLHNIAPHPQARDVHIKDHTVVDKANTFSSLASRMYRNKDFPLCFRIILKLKQYTVGGVAITDAIPHGMVLDSETTRSVARPARQILISPILPGDDTSAACTASGMPECSVPAQRGSTAPSGQDDGVSSTVELSHGNHENRTPAFNRNEYNACVRYDSSSMSNDAGYLFTPTDEIDRAARVFEKLRRGDIEQERQTVKAWRKTCDIFQLKYQDNPTGFPLKSWKIQLQPHQAMCAVEILAHEAKGWGGGFLSDEHGLNTAVEVLAVAQITMEICHIRRSLELWQRRAIGYQHSKDGIEPCPSQRFYSVQCVCQKNSPVHEWTLYSGYTLVWTLDPCRIADLIKAFDSSIDTESQIPFKLRNAVREEVYGDPLINDNIGTLGFAIQDVSDSDFVLQNLDRCANNVVIFSSYQHHDSSEAKHAQGTKPSRVFIDESHIEKDPGSGVFVALRTHFPKDSATVYGPRIWPVSGTPWKSNLSEIRGYWDAMRGCEIAYWHARETGQISDSLARVSFPEDVRTYMHKWDEPWYHALVARSACLLEGKKYQDESFQSTIEVVRVSIAQFLRALMIRRTGDTRRPNGKTPLVQLPDPEQKVIQLDLNAQDLELLDIETTVMLRALVDDYYEAIATWQRRTDSHQGQDQPILPAKEILTYAIKAQPISSWPRLSLLRDSDAFGERFYHFTQRVLCEMGWYRMNNNPIADNLELLTEGNPKIDALRKIITEMLAESQERISRIQTNLGQTEYNTQTRLARRKLVILSPLAWSCDIIFKYLSANCLDMPAVRIGDWMRSDERIMAWEQFSDATVWNESASSKEFKHKESPVILIGTLSAVEPVPDLQRADRLVIWDTFASNDETNRAISCVHRLGQSEVAKIMLLAVRSSAVEEYVFNADASKKLLTMLIREFKGASKSND